jgi:Protein of unknown function (DUF3617)
MVSLKSRRAAAAALVFFTSPFAAWALADDPAPATKGDLWETTSQMSMEGAPMKMPATTVKICSPKEWREPPGGADKAHNCKSSNMQTTGNKITWDVKCTGPDMTGAGEIVREGTDAYNGSIKFASEHGTMTIKLNGKKVGECDNPQ